MLPVHLDGGDEGPGMGCYCLSPDDLAPLGAWWVQVIFCLPCGTGKSRVPMSYPRNLPWYPSSLITCRGQSWEQDGASQAEDEEPSCDHGGTEWAATTTAGVARGGGS